MATRHLVDPELLEMLGVMMFPDLSAETLAGMREAMRMVPQPEQIDDGIRVSERHIPGNGENPTVRALVYQTENQGSEAVPGLLHIHGGGYIMGSADNSQARCRLFARELNCTVISVDYRLAPETPFPGPVEDCYAALKWLADNATALGVDCDRLAVTGESAGGGLAASVALMARDRGQISLVHQALVYPMLDDRVGAEDQNNPLAGEFVWTRASNRFGWNCYLGGRAGAADIPPYAAPARASDLAGLPTTYIGTGSLDLFAEENIDYARRLMRAGVPVELRILPGAYHGFDANPRATATESLRTDILRGLKRAFGAATRG